MRPSRARWAQPGRINATTDRRNESDLVAIGGAIVRLDILVVDGKRDAIGMAAEGGKFSEHPLPDLADGDSLGSSRASSAACARSRSVANNLIVSRFMEMP